MNNMPYMVFAVEVEFDTVMGKLNRKFYFADRDEAEKFRRKGKVHGVRFNCLAGLPIATCDSAFRSVQFDRKEMSSHLAIK